MPSPPSAKERHTAETSSDDRVKYTLHLPHIICCQGLRVDRRVLSRPFTTIIYILNTRSKHVIVQHCDKLTLASVKLYKLLYIKSQWFYTKLCIACFMLWQCGQIDMPTCVHVCMCVYYKNYQNWTSVSSMIATACLIQSFIMMHGGTNNRNILVRHTSAVAVYNC